MNNQQNIDFDRAGQLARIRDFARSLPRTISVSEGQRTLKLAATSILAVVRTIDDRAGRNSWCSLSVPNLAAESCISERSAFRVIGWLESQDLVIKKRTKTSNRLRLVYSNLIDDDVENPSVENTQSSNHTLPQEHHTLPQEHHTLPQKPHTLPPVADKAQYEAQSRSANTKKRRQPAVRRSDFVSFETIAAYQETILRTVSISKPNDIWLINRVASLVHLRRVSEADMATVLESIRYNESSIENPVAYFRNAVIRRCFDGDSVAFESVINQVKVERQRIGNKS